MIKRLVILLILTVVTMFTLNYTEIYILPYTWENGLYTFLVLLGLYILYTIFYKFFKMIVSLLMIVLFLFIIYYVYHFITGNSLDFMPF